MPRPPMSAQSRPQQLSETLGSYNMSVTTMKSLRYLNNAGVALLERGSTRQAYATFKELVFASRHAFCSHNNDGDSAASAALVAEKVQSASFRLANPKLCTGASQIAVNVVDEDACLSDLFSAPCRAALHPVSFPGLTSVSPVRIEAIEDPDIMTAIAVLNFGMAHVCVARTTTPSGRAQLQTGAIKLYGLCHSILQGLSQQAMEDDNNDWLLTKIIFLMAVVLTSLSPVLTEAGKLSSAKECSERVAHLREALYHAESLPEQCPRQSAAAAA